MSRRICSGLNCKMRIGEVAFEPACGCGSCAYCSPRCRRARPHGDKTRPCGCTPRCSCVGTEACAGCGEDCGERRCQVETCLAPLCSDKCTEVHTGWHVDVSTKPEGCEFCPEREAKTCRHCSVVICQRCKSFHYRSRHPAARRFCTGCVKSVYDRKWLPAACGCERHSFCMEWCRKRHVKEIRRSAYRGELVPSCGCGRGCEGCTSIPSL
jgi:hypothetical protein